MFAKSLTGESVRPFRDRFEAGKLLATRLTQYSDRTDVHVSALPRGGLPVAFEIAQAIHAPLDIFLVRKLGVPGHEELAMGAIATGNVRLLQTDIVEAFGISSQIIDAATEEGFQELARRERAYRGSRPEPVVRGKTIILVDDGLATGSTMQVAVAALKEKQPKRMIVAVPVAAPEACNELKDEVDEIICLETPPSFSAVGLWYDDFSQVTDREVRELLARADRSHSSGHSASGAASHVNTTYPSRGLVIVPNCIQRPARGLARHPRSAQPPGRRAGQGSRDGVVQHYGRAKASRYETDFDRFRCAGTYPTSCARARKR